MKKKIILIVTIAGCLSGQYANVFGDSMDSQIKELDKQVSVLITEKQDYDSALSLYASAARRNTGEAYYRDQYSVLRRVIKMKSAVESEALSADTSKSAVERWDAYYQAIRCYYYDNGFYSESVKLDAIAAEKLKTGQALTNYLETLVILDKSHIAENVISQADDSLRDSAGFAVLELLLRGRNNGDISGLADLAAKIVPKENSRNAVYLACLYQLKGDQDGAYEHIVKALENTIPPQIPMTRKLIERMKEFDGIRETDRYHSSVETQSKIYLSDCTGGSSCNSCSLRDKCSK